VKVVLPLHHQESDTFSTIKNSDHAKPNQHPIRQLRKTDYRISNYGSFLL
jgi:hypothetical protein